MVIGLGSLLISLAALFNGERSGGPAGYDELYYLWVVFYAAYYLRRRSLALQVLLIAVAYGVTLVLVDPGPIATSRWLTVIGLVTGGAVVVRLLTEHVEQLMAELDSAASTDRLTGLANRRALEADFRREAARAARTGESTAIVLIDLNRFKDINDVYGHAAGDTALVGIAERMRLVLREMDVAARIGGDEFLLLLPDADADAATAVALRLTESAATRDDGSMPIGLELRRRSVRGRHREPRRPDAPGRSGALRGQARPLRRCLIEHTAQHAAGPSLNRLRASPPVREDGRGEPRGPHRAADDADGRRGVPRVHAPGRRVPAVPRRAGLPRARRDPGVGRPRGG